MKVSRQFKILITITAASFALGVIFLRLIYTSGPLAYVPLSSGSLTALILLAIVGSFVLAALPLKRGKKYEF